MAFPLSDAEHVAIRQRIESQEELIVAAAIRWGKVIVVAERPGRHGDCIWPMHSLGLEHRDQGFMTNRGRFVDRAEAARIVIASGQTTPRDGMEHLFSEDVWNDTDTEMADHHPRFNVAPVAPKDGTTERQPEPREAIKNLTQGEGTP